jgi:hypothetical protein
LEFWLMAWERKWVSLEDLRTFVITEKNIYGEITPEQFEEITGVEF